MPTIKTHCWCVFSDADAAARAVEGLQGLRFPDHRVDGRTLSAALVAVEDARRIIEAQSEAVLQGAGEADAAGEQAGCCGRWGVGGGWGKCCGGAGGRQGWSGVLWLCLSIATRVSLVVIGFPRFPAGAADDRAPVVRRGRAPDRLLGDALHQAVQDVGARRVPACICVYVEAFGCSGRGRRGCLRLCMTLRGFSAGVAPLWQSKT